MYVLFGIRVNRFECVHIGLNRERERDGERGRESEKERGMGERITI